VPDSRLTDGSRLLLQGATSCVVCPPGRYSRNTSSVLLECVWCTGGKISNGTGAEACESCLPGKYAAGDKSRCISCPSDSSSPKTSDQQTDCECNAGYTGHAVNVSDLQNPGDDCWDGCNHQQGPCSWCGTGMCCRHNWHNTSNGCSGALGIPGRGHVCVNADGSLNSTVDGGGFVCAACEAAKYKATVGSSLCWQCPPGKYSATIGQSMCIDCPAHAYSPSGSGLLTNCTCNKGYTGPDGVTCSACIAGTYKDVNGSVPCTLCAKGKYSTETGEMLESTCSQCPAYTRSPDGSSMLINCTCNKGYTGSDGIQCAACIAGTYKDVNGSALCSLCLRGKYSTAIAAISESTCSKCPTHSYSGIGSSQLTNCTCNKGYTGPDGAACGPCIAGTYKDVNGSAPCTLCSKGTYSAETAQISESTCNDCPAHAFSGVGSGLLTNCTCNKGYTGPDGAECEACEAASFKDVNGSSACTLCPGGKYSAATAAISNATCLGCPSYTYSGAGSGLLTNCTCWRGYTGSGGENCTACVASKYKDVNGSAACSLCPAGKYSAETGVSVCSMCPDHALSEAGSMNMSNCACNKGYTGANGTQCNACPHGTYKASFGSAECGSCPQNTFSNTSASVQCTACAYGTYRLNSSFSAKNCSVCPNFTINLTLPLGCPM